MTVTSPETVARGALKSLLVVEFAPEGFPVHDDRLHASVGSKGTQIGTSPVRSQPRAQDMNVLRVELLVQFYSLWKKAVDPEQHVDPAIIENYAERFRRALEDGDPHQNNVWYFRLLSINYPPDPTGNITRFEAHVEALGNNSAVIETVG